MSTPEHHSERAPAAAATPVSPSDRRRTEIVLTDGGRAMLRRMWAVYEDGIARGFAIAVPEPEALADALAPVVAALRAAPQPVR